MNTILKRLRGSDFVRHNTIVFVGSIAISAINYLYYPALGRLLQPAAFGEVQTIISLFLQVAIFLNVLALLTVNIVANYDSQQTEQAKRRKAQATIFELERVALIVGTGGLLLTAVLSGLLQDFFRFESALPFILLALALVVSIPGAFRMAYLRGKLLFGANSWAGLIGSAAKLAFSVLFVLAGWGVTGAIAGLVLAQLAAFLYSGRKAKQAGFGPSLRGSFWQLPDLKLIVPELKYAGLVLATSLSITALYSIDIIAVKHYFDAQTAGLYAGIATVARIIFFATGSIPQVLLPMVKLNNPPRQNQRTLLYSALLLLGIGGVVLALFWLLPELVIRLLMGANYTEYASLLPHLGLVLFVVSVLNLIMQYFLALRRYAVGIIAIIGLVVTCGLVVASHSSPQAIVDSMLYGSLISLGLLIVWAGVVEGKTKKGDVYAA